MTWVRRFILCSMLFSGFVQARGDDTRANDSRTNGWQLQVGYVHQWGRGMSVKGPAPAISGSDLLPVLGSRELFNGAPSIPLTGFIDRNYNDGFVHVDIFTGDPGLLNSDPTRYGMTWNWGANNNNNSQYNFDNGNHPTLSFHVNDREATLGATTQSSEGSGDNDLPTDGLELKFSHRLCSWTNFNPDANCPVTWTNGNATLDFVIGVALFPEACQHVGQQASLGLYAVNETYTYFDYYGDNANGGWGPLTFPYTGSMGTFGGPPAGPLIPELPETWTYGTGGLLGTATDRVSIDSEIWRVRGEVGLTLTKELSERLSGYVSPQLALEFLAMNATRHETLTYTDGSGTTIVSSRSDSSQKATIVPGLLLTGGIDYLISENWYLGASLGWEWLVREPSIRVGTSRVSFNLDGGECSLYLGRHF